MPQHVSAWMDADLEFYRQTVRRFVEKNVAAQEEKWRQ